ncbi:MAG: hypothetical protein IJ325_02130 [Clostridia bacterium]|nr:hypothetical protein [Clostridia bacterium]
MEKWNPVPKTARNPGISTKNRPSAKKSIQIFLWETFPEPKQKSLFSTPPWADPSYFRKNLRDYTKFLIVHKFGKRGRSVGKPYHGKQSEKKSAADVENPIHSPAKLSTAAISRKNQAFHWGKHPLFPRILWNSASFSTTNLQIFRKFSTTCGKPCGKPKVVVLNLWGWCGFWWGSVFFAGEGEKLFDKKLFSLPCTPPSFQKTLKKGAGFCLGELHQFSGFKSYVTPHPPLRGPPSPSGEGYTVWAIGG